MINKTYFSDKILPVLTAIFVFLLVDVLYFAPQFQDKELKMHDITQYEGMGRDIELHMEQYDEDPQWAGRMFSGMPSYFIRMSQPAMFIPKVGRGILEFLGYPASLIFVSMLSFYFMLLLWGLNPWLSIIPALGYGLSSYMFIIIGAGHVTKMATLAYAPLMLGTIFYAYRKNMWMGAALTAPVATIELAAAHPQITYYFLMIVLAFVVNEAVKAYKDKWLPRFYKTTAVLLLSGVLALGANLSALYYTTTSAKHTMRGGSELAVKDKDSKGLDLDYATQWSYGLTESFNLLIPNLMGGQSGGGFSSDGQVADALTKYNARNMASQLPGYWGDQPMTSGPVYIGAVIVFLAVFGFFVLHGLASWWVLVVSAVALVLAWGHNMSWFTELFFNYFPGYNKFRTVSMILVILQWSLPFAGALALGYVWNKSEDKRKILNALKRALITTGGICLLFLLLGGSFFWFSSATDASMGLPEDVLYAMRQERESLLRADCIRSLIFIVLTAALLWLFIQNKVKKSVFVAVLAVLTITDLVGVAVRYLPQSKFVRTEISPIKMTEADKLILQDKQLGYRVANFSVSIFNDATTSYFHRSVGGYHGAKLSRYQDLIEHQLSQMNLQVYNMLNTKYFISADDSGKLQVEQNADANGAAWFVDSLIVSTTPSEEMQTLTKLNTKTQAVVDKSFNQTKALSGAGYRNIKLVDYKPNHLTYNYKADNAQTAVFSEVYYPDGWSAYVDGKPAEYFRVNYVLRAMQLPEGEHTIEFKFRAPHYGLISAITLICSIIITVGFVLAVVLYLKNHFYATRQ